eukprot:687153-Amorphochlora_amoeboformis.AAC.1
MPTNCPKKKEIAGNATSELQCMIRRGHHKGRRRGTISVRCALRGLVTVRLRLRLRVHSGYGYIALVG